MAAPIWQLTPFLLCVNITRKTLFFVSNVTYPLHYVYFNVITELAGSEIQCLHLIVVFRLVSLIVLLTQQYVLCYYLYVDTLIGASLVNIVAGVAKDTYYAKMFSGKPISKFPLASWGLFVFRDVVTIGAGFTIPGFVSKMLHDSEVIKTKSVADKVAQLTTPMIAQIVLTPIHLMALDLYNSKGTVVRTWGERGGRIFPFFVETTLIRMARMFCAYGIGGIANGGVRKELRGRVLRNATATA